MKSILKNEDWLISIIASAIILLVITTRLNLAVKFGWSDASELAQKIIISEHTFRYLQIAVIILVIGVLLSILLQKNTLKFIASLSTLLFLSYISFVVAGNSYAKNLGLEFVLFSLALGLLISNTIGVSSWLKEGLLSEFYVKIGLVILGTGILFPDIIKAGALGLIQACIVVTLVWYFAFYLCKWLNIDKEFSLMVASAVSICGVSAAIATSGVIHGDNKKLSYVISLVMITAIPMMLFMPYLANYIHLTPSETGAWLGGTIDTTGAVVASSSIAGDEALATSTIIKFSQNVLLGVAAFLISIYWTYYKKSNVANTSSTSKIWSNFPKFILGFTAASLLFSFIIPDTIVSSSKDTLKTIQQIWFSISFLSIGLETKFSDFLNTDNRKVALSFLGAQLFNIILTLGIAVWLF